MNKDTLVASIIGLVLGLIAAIGLWVVPRLLTKSPSPVKTETVENQTAADSAQINNQDLIINTPVDGEISKSKQITVSGQTAKDAQLILTTPNTQKVINVSDGKFSTEIELAEGGNSLVVTNLKDKNAVIKNLFVFYFDQNL